MKTILTSLFILSSTISLIAQNVEVINENRAKTFAAGEKKPILFGKTLLDYGYSGQLQASTQALKINIGEPQGFYLPVYLLVGTANGDLGSNESNKGTVASLINSSGGTVNLSGNFYVNLLKSSSGITSLKFSTLLGGKLVTGRDVTTGSGLFKPSGFAESGLYFQTGAWEDGGQYKDGGIFWLQARYAALTMSKDDLRSFFGDDALSAPTGPKIELGIFIESKVNIKLSFFKPVTGTKIPTLSSNQFKLALDYSVSK